MPANNQVQESQESKLNNIFADPPAPDDSPDSKPSSQAGKVVGEKNGVKVYSVFEPREKEAKKKVASDTTNNKATSAPTETSRTDNASDKTNSAEKSDGSAAKGTNAVLSSNNAPPSAQETSSNSDAASTSPIQEIELPVPPQNRPEPELPVNDANPKDTDSSSKHAETGSAVGNQPELSREKPTDSEVKPNEPSDESTATSDSNSTGDVGQDAATTIPQPVDQNKTNDSSNEIEQPAIKANQATDPVTSPMADSAPENSDSNSNPSDAAVNQPNGVEVDNDQSPKTDQGKSNAGSEQTTQNDPDAEQIDETLTRNNSDQSSLDVNETNSNEHPATDSKTELATSPADAKEQTDVAGNGEQEDTNSSSTSSDPPSIDKSAPNRPVDDERSSTTDLVPDDDSPTSPVQPEPDPAPEANAANPEQSETSTEPVDSKTDLNSTQPPITSTVQTPRSTEPSTSSSLLDYWLYGLIALLIVGGAIAFRLFAFGKKKKKKKNANADEQPTEFPDSLEGRGSSEGIIKDFSDQLHPGIEGVTDENILREVEALEPTATQFVDNDSQEFDFSADSDFDLDIEKTDDATIKTELTEANVAVALTAFNDGESDFKATAETTSTDKTDFTTSASQNSEHSMTLGSDDFTAVATVSDTIDAQVFDESNSQDTPSKSFKVSELNVSNEFLGSLDKLKSQGLEEDLEFDDDESDIFDFANDEDSVSASQSDSATQQQNIVAIHTPLSAETNANGESEFDEEEPTDERTSGRIGATLATPSAGLDATPVQSHQTPDDYSSQENTLQLQTENETLKSEIDSIRARELELEELLGQYDAERSGLAARLAERELQLNETTRVAEANAASASKLDEAFGTIESLKETNRELESSVTTLQADLNHAVKQLEQATEHASDKDKLEAEVSELRETLHQKTTELDSVKSDLQSTRSDVEELTTELESAKIELDEISNGRKADEIQTQSLQKQNQELTDQLAEKSTALDSEAALVKQKSSELDLVSADLRQATQKLQTLESELEQARKDLELQIANQQSLQDEKAADVQSRNELESKLQAATSELEELCQALEQSKSEREQISAVVEQQEAQLKSAHELKLQELSVEHQVKIEGLANELQAVQEKSQIEAEQAATELASVVEQHESVVDSLKSELTEMKAKCDAADDELESLKTQISDHVLREKQAEEKVSTAESEFSGVVAELEESRNEANGLRSQLEQNETALKNSQLELADAAKKISDLLVDLDQRTAELQSVTSELESERQNKSEQVNIAQEWQTKFTQLESELATANANLTELENSLLASNENRKEAQSKIEELEDALASERSTSKSELDELRQELDETKRENLSLSESIQRQNEEQPRPGLMDLASATSAAPTGAERFRVGSQDKAMLELIKKLKKENRKRKQADQLLEEVEAQRTELACELKQVRDRVSELESREQELLAKLSSASEQQG